VARPHNAFTTEAMRGALQWMETTHPCKSSGRRSPAHRCAVESSVNESLSGAMPCTSMKVKHVRCAFPRFQGAAYMS